MKTTIVVFLLMIIVGTACNEKQEEQVLATGAIPFTLTRGVPTIKLTMNGVTASYLVDTGASRSVLFTQYKKKLNFNVLNEIEGSQFTGVGGGTAMYRINNAIALHNGSLFLNFRVGARITTVASRLQIVGIIGSDILSTGWIVDYSNNTLIKK